MLDEYMKKKEIVDVLLGYVLNKLEVFFQSVEDTGVELDSAALSCKVRLNEQGDVAGHVERESDVLYAVHISHDNGLGYITINTDRGVRLFRSNFTHSGGEVEINDGQLSVEYEGGVGC